MEGIPALIMPLIVVGSVVSGITTATESAAAGTVYALLVGLFLLSDQISAGQYGGMVLLTCGIALMARGVFTDGESRQMIPFALGSAMATASYTLIDGMGARVAADAATSRIALRYPAGGASLAGEIRTLDRDCRVWNASPGGAADLLSCAMFFSALEDKNKDLSEKSRSSKYGIQL